jgi:alkylation response protein AidB-like acyl-CoA dehydrogenase
MKRTFDAVSKYAKSRVSAGKPIIAYQEIGFKLVETLTLLQTAQLLAYRAAAMAESGNGEAGALSSRENSNQPCHDTGKGLGAHRSHLAKSAWGNHSRRAWFTQLNSK